MDILKQPPEGGGWIRIMASVPLSHDRMDEINSLVSWHGCDSAFVEADYSPINEMIGCYDVDVLVKHRKGKDVRIYEAIITKADTAYWEDERMVIPAEENGLNEDDLDVMKWIIDHMLYGWETKKLKIEKMMLPVSVDAKLVECDETGIKIYDSLSCQYDMWERPFDKEPARMHFINEHAYDCYYGHVYGKDFRYFECCKCGRVICEQNPSNGWHVQYRSWDDGYGKICLKCYEGHIIEHGIDIGRLKNDIPGMFLGDDEAIERGWIKDKDYFVNYGNEAWVKEEIMKLYNAGNKILITYFSLGMGGSEGTISVFYKSREQGDDNATKR